MKTLKNYTTSAGNKLQFIQLSKTQMLVVDNSCLMERTYIKGQNQILSFDDYEKELKDQTLIVSFAQVMRAWTNEEIHF